MKKILLISAALLTASGTFAAGPYVKGPAYIEDFPVQFTSPNGKYIGVSEAGLVITMNLETGEEKTYFDSDGVKDYGLGQIGYCISDNGIAVGYTNIDRAATLDIDKGVWTELPAKSTAQVHCFAIAEDGSFVVGNMTPDQLISEGQDDVLNFVPVIWERGSDGKYGQPKVLPYPTRDWVGRIPQSIRALAISTDGNRIGGQVTDAYGYQRQPVYWERKADNTWELVHVMPQLLNPDNVEIPEYPVQTLELRDATSFMSATERAQYEAAIEKWNEDNAEGTPDYSTYPEISDFMTAEEIKAFTEYADAYNEINDKQLEWMEKYVSVLDKAPTFIQNAVCFNGSVYACGVNYPDPAADPDADQVTMLNAVLRIDVDKNTCQRIDDIMINSLTNDNVILATQVDDTYLKVNSVVVLPDATAPSSWRDWMAGINPEFGTWIGENMCHDYTTMVDKEVSPGVWEQVQETIPDMLFSAGDPGGAFTTGSCNLVVVRVDNIWSDEGAVYMGYLFPTELQSGIDGVSASNDAAVGLTALRGGLVRVAGTAKSLQVVDLQGRTVFETIDAEGDVNTGVTDGLYIVRATDADGNEAVCKAIF